MTYKAYCHSEYYNEMMKITDLLPRLFRSIESIRCVDGAMGKVRLFFVLFLLIPFLFSPIRHRLCTLRAGEGKPRIMLIYRSVLNSLCTGMRVTVGGVKYVLDNYEHLMILPFYGYWLWDYLNIQKGEMFLDVGAHVGKYALQVARIVGENGLVVAIEPDSENYSALKRTIELNKLQNVIAVNAAAWNCDTKLKFSLAGSSLGSSVKFDFGRGSAEVEARMLDSVLQEIGVARVNWVKINVEGAEFETLKGLEDTLRSFLPDVISEVEHDNVEEVTAFMRAIGYIVEMIPTAHNKDVSYYLFHPAQQTCR